MAKFKHKNGGYTEVFTELNIKRLRANKNYVEVPENEKKEDKKPLKEKKEVEEKPLQ